MTEIEVHRGSTLTLESDQTFWTDNQVAGLRQLGVDRASNGDLAVYLHVCQRTGLDPFARQIYMIERQGKQTIQTGIDGFRLVARRAVDRTGETLSIGASEWCDAEGNWTDVWLPNHPPAAARVVVYRNGEPFPGTALWREYAQTKRDGGLTAMWESRPAGQLAKCAEALALRRAFPHDLSGVYTDDELANVRQAQRQTSRLGVVLGTETSGAGEEVQEPSSPGSDAVAASSGEPSAPEPDSEAITDAQLRKIGALMGSKGLGITDRTEALGYVASKVARPIESRSDLSKSEATVLIDSLEADVALLEPVDGEVVQ